MTNRSSFFARLDADQQIQLMRNEPEQNLKLIRTFLIKEFFKSFIIFFPLIRNSLALREEWDNRRLPPDPTFFRSSEILSFLILRY